MTHEEYLAHYGVKGMRWGVRKDRRSGSGRSRERTTLKERRAARKQAERAKRSSERRAVDDIRTTKKKAKYMTDDELRLAINRLNLETQYNRLSMEVYTPGLKYAKDLALRAGNQSASAFVNDALKKVRNRDQ